MLISNIRSTSLLFVLSLSSALWSQTAPPETKNVAIQPSLPPATKIEAFQPAVGSVVTFGYDNIGGGKGISIDARQFQDSNGTSVRGIQVEVTEGEYRKESSYIDMDEIPELLKAFDAMLQVKSNPTLFKNFEVRYTTKGDLRLTAFNDSRGEVLYAVRAGRITTAQSVGLNIKMMENLRALFVTAQQKLTSLDSKM
jgi:hypothetical protein